MVQYAEIKEVEKLLETFRGSIVTPMEIKQAREFLIKYHTILEGWYGNEQYHNKVEEGIEL